ncbi:hypothetical protein pipiens_007341 [Culex pipiens pipiens]|uniref:Ionotropic receptor n=1 Tax=Culex pipiens pipiens TaxID=38569 RepID=A0ABD1DLF8_CULPP
MLANTSLAVLTVLSNSLELSTEFGLEMFIEECKQIRDVYYPECRESSMRGSELTVYSNHQYKEGRIDEYLERLWIYYFCETTGCHSKLEGIRFAAKGSFDLLLDPSPNVSRVLLPLFPYRTVKYSIYVRTPEKRFRMFACFYTFSPTLWVVLIIHARLLNTVQPLVNADPCPVGWPHWLNLLNRVCSSIASRVAFVETSSFLLEYQFFRQTSLPCQLSVIMENVFQIQKAIMVRRGYPYKEDIGKIFMKVTESGIANLVTRHVYDVIRSRNTEETIQEGYLRISLRQLTVTFSLLAIGAGLAGVSVILEWIAYFRQQRNIIPRASSNPK